MDSSGTIFGLEPQDPLPENSQPYESVALVKCLRADGELELAVRPTHGLTIWEELGMLRAAVVQVEAQIAAEMIDES